VHSLSPYVGQSTCLRQSSGLVLLTLALVEVRGACTGECLGEWLAQRTHRQSLGGTVREVVMLRRMPQKHAVEVEDGVVLQMLPLLLVWARLVLLHPWRV